MCNRVFQSGNAGVTSSSHIRDLIRQVRNGTITLASFSRIPIPESLFGPEDYIPLPALFTTGCIVLPSAQPAPRLRSVSSCLLSKRTDSRIKVCPTMKLLNRRQPQLARPLQAASWLWDTPSFDWPVRFLGRSRRPGPHCEPSDSTPTSRTGWHWRES